MILVSRGFAPWLDDYPFLSRLLTATGLAGFSKEQDLTLLTAAVDKVPCYSSDAAGFGSSEGISVILGSSGGMLPNLWMPPGPPTSTEQASLEFVPRQAERLSPRLTLPLANTLFATGEPHALVASRWRALPGRAPVVVHKLQRTQATIALPDKQKAAMRINLIPVTPPRKILASLGNVLSKIEIDGRPAPPSQELEAIVPKLIESRHKARGSRRAEDCQPGPVGVWALTIPKSLLDTYPIHKGTVYGDRPASAARNGFDWAMLMANGCKLSKICECPP